MRVCVCLCATAAEFLGCFEQVDPAKQLKQRTRRLLQMLQQVTELLLATAHPEGAGVIQSLFDSAARLAAQDAASGGAMDDDPMMSNSGSTNPPGTICSTPRMFFMYSTLLL